MRASLVVLALVLLAACLAVADDVSEQVRRVERQWADATVHRDLAALNRIIADDLKYVHGNASVQDKKQFIDSLKSGDLIYHSIDFEEMDVRPMGDSAVVMSKLRLHITMGGQDQKFEVRFLRV